MNKHLKTAIEQAAVDYGADVSVFDGGVHILQAKPFTERARRTKIGTPFLDMVFFGNGLLAVTGAKIQPYIECYIAKCGNDLFRVLDAPNVFMLDDELNKHGYRVSEIAQAFLPSVESHKPECNDNGLRLVVLRGIDISSLYTYKCFSEALCYDTDKSRRDEIAVVYYDKDKPVAVAACSNDSDSMWQIGVDVLPGYRGRGLALSLVAKLSDLIEEAGKTPFYRCAWSNIASRRTAYRAGYADAWIELFSGEYKEHNQ